MTPLSNDILKNYQVRKSNKQKLAFIDLLQKHFPQLVIEESRFPKCRNLVIGDPEKAKVVLTAHYDTCARAPLPNFIMPKNPMLSILYGLVMGLPGLLAAFLVIALLYSLGMGFWANYSIAFGLYMLYTLLLVIGPANKHTANDNTSGVVVLCELLQTLNAQQKADLAFVFFDHEESGLIGSAQFRSKHKNVMKEKLLINFDCVSDGDHILVAASKDARNRYGALLKSSFLPTSRFSVLFSNLERIYYPSDQAGFKTAVAVAALKRKKLLGYYMDRIHTPKDTVFEKENITYLCNSILQLTKKL